MNTTVTVQIDNLPSVQQELAKARAEIERLTAMVAVLTVNALRGPYKSENLPPDYEPKWINVTTSGMGHNRYVLHTPPVNPH